MVVKYISIARHPRFRIDLHTFAHPVWVGIRIANAKHAHIEQQKTNFVANTLLRNAPHNFTETLHNFCSRETDKAFENYFNRYFLCASNPLVRVLLSLSMSCTQCSVFCSVSPVPGSQCPVALYTFYMYVWHLEFTTAVISTMLTNCLVFLHKRFRIASIHCGFLLSIDELLPRRHSRQSLKINNFNYACRTTDGTALWPRMFPLGKCAFVPL